MNARCPSHPIWLAACAALTATLLLTAAQPAAAQPGWVLSHQKINEAEGGFTGTLGDSDNFGSSAASLGDLDGDGVGAWPWEQPRMATGATDAVRCGCCFSTRTEQ